MSEIIRTVKKIIKFFIPGPARIKIRKLMDNREYIRKIKKMNIKRSGGKRIFILGTPEHSNLGDIAITAAEYEFLRDKFKDTPVYDFTFSEIKYAADNKINYLKKIINNKDIIILNGGGNMGSLWHDEDIMRFIIINMFPENKIVIFPQSIYYEQTADGDEKLEESRQKYAAHKDLHIISRDMYSYELMKKYYPACSLYLAPDIVLWLDRQEPRFERDGVLLCFRADKEKNISDGKITGVRKLIESKTSNIKFTDTVLHDIEYIERGQRDFYVDEKLNEFKRAKLVITDRLHGMVFAAVTATPCIVLANSYHKIKGLYEWLQDLDYIKFIADADNIEAAAKELWGLENIYYDNKNIKYKFDFICDII